MLAALTAWSPISTAMRCRDTAATVSSGGIAGVRARRVGLRALDVEGRRETGPLSLL
jgi:hypothetical protein